MTGEVNLIVTGDVSLNQDSGVNIASSGASLHLYANGNVTLNANSSINDNGRPVNCTIYGTGTASNLGIRLNNNSRFFGTIIAPNADLEFINDGVVCGAVIGKTAQFNASSGFHYDVSLNESPAAYVRLNAWVELIRPAASGHGLARDNRQPLEFSKPTVPLAASSAIVFLEQKTGFSRQHYRVTVSLRLLQPLYVPAHSNGTLEYEQLRLGLATARAGPPPASRPDLGSFPPELPQLVRRSHFAGEKTRITTTVEARRSGWRWKFAAPDRFALVCRRPFQGGILRSFGNVAVYDELRPDPALNARLDEVRSYLRRRAGADTAGSTIRGAHP